jgi:hypothetical protein
LEENVKALDVQDRLEYARSAVAVLRSLQINEKTMSYGEFAKAIGLIPDTEGWKPWHRQQVAEILNLVAAAELQGAKSHNIRPLQYERVVTRKTKQPGKGISKESRIVRK